MSGYSPSGCDKVVSETERRTKRLKSCGWCVGVEGDARPALAGLDYRAARECQDPGPGGRQVRIIPHPVRSIIIFHVPQIARDTTWGKGAPLFSSVKCGGVRSHSSISQMLLAPLAVGTGGGQL